MSDLSAHADAERWRRVHSTAADLRAALIALGVPESELAHITGRPTSPAATRSTSARSA